MQRLMRKFAPLLVVAAFVGWCCGSQLREPAPLLAMEEPDVDRIDHRALRPQIRDAHPRDPFRRAQAAPEMATDVDEPPPPPPPEPPVNTRQLVESLRLDATVTSGSQPLAIINGHIYAEGQPIAFVDLPNVRCQLLSVGRARAVLLINEEPFEIECSHTTPSGKRSERRPQVLRPPTAAPAALPQERPAPPPPRDVPATPSSATGDDHQPPPHPASGSPD